MSVCDQCATAAAKLTCGKCETGAWCSVACQRGAWESGEHPRICADLQLGKIKLTAGMSSFGAPGKDSYFPIEPRVRGLVLGMAVADHVGARVVGNPRDFFAGREDVFELLLSTDPAVTEVEGGQLSAATESWIATAQGLMATGAKADRSVARWLLRWSQDVPTVPPLLRAILSPSVSTDVAAPERVLSAGAAAKPLNSSIVLVRMSALSLAQSRGGREFEKDADAVARLTHASESARHAAVAYALICQRLVYGATSKRGEEALDAAREYLKRVKSTLLAMLDQADQDARLTSFVADSAVTGQGFRYKESPDECATALYGVVWFLRQALARRASWLEAVRSIVATGGARPNVSAALVGGMLGAFYGAEQLPAEWIGHVLSYVTDRPAWLNAQRLPYLCEALARKGLSIGGGGGIRAGVDGDD